MKILCFYKGGFQMENEIEQKMQREAEMRRRMMGGEGMQGRGMPGMGMPLGAMQGMMGGIVESKSLKVVNGKIVKEVSVEELELMIKRIQTK